MPEYRSSKPSLVSTALLAIAFLLVQAPPADGQKVVAQPSKAAATGTADHALHTVRIKDFKYSPPVLTVKAGDTVEWKNADIFTHTVTAVDKSFDSGPINPGSSWKFVARRTGSFNYVCTLHPNMRAKLVVQ